MAANRFQLPADMEEWFREYYPVTTDKALADTLGCCTITVWRLAQRRGLRKSPEHLERVKRRSIEIATEANKNNPERMRKLREYGLKHAFKKGVSNLERYGFEKNEERKKKVTAGYLETFKKEKARVAFGLPQKTKMRVSRQNPEKARFKWYLQRRGYIVDDKTRTVYWNENTNRGPRVETKDQPWYTFKQQEAV